MLYENYQKKILKVAETLKKIIRLLPLIIPALAIVIASIITLLAVKGSVGDITCPDEIIYGEQIECEATAFLSKVRYEYSADEKSWSEEHPTLPGKYFVRAAANGSFGSTKYSDAQSFTVLPKSLTVSIPNTEIEYGEKLKVTGKTAYDDKIVCNKFIVDDNWLATGEASPNPVDDILKPPIADSKQLDIAPDPDNITVVDKNGNDVTSAYIIETKTTEILLKSRPLTVKINDLTHVYDGKPFSGGECVITRGSLNDGDSIAATFSAKLVDVGSATNTPKLKIVNESGIDVTGYYSVTAIIGELRVKERPLTVTFENSTVEYNGDVLFTNHAHMVDPSTPLAEGHSTVASGSTLISDCGNYVNEATVKIYDENGIDQTKNYSLNLTRGRINVTPKPLEITTHSGSWLYDGVDHTQATYDHSQLVKDQYIETDITPAIRNVGIIENKLSVKIYSNGRDVTKNYNISYNYGTLEVTPRILTVTTHDAVWMYDGEIHSAPEFWQSGDQILPFQIVEIIKETSIRDVGKIENAFEIKIYGDVYDGGEYDATDNYVIDYKYGTLEIVKRPVEISTQNNVWIYDGEEHYCQEYFSISEFDIAYTDTLKFYGWQSITNVGSITNSVTGYEIYREEDGKKIDVTKNYDITLSYGTLEVSPRPIFCKPVDVEKVYDDTPLTPSEAEIAENSPFDLVKGHVLVASYKGSITDVGSNRSTIYSVKIMNGDEDVSYNYDIKKISGNLTITPRQITVYTESAVKDSYDGYALTNRNFGVYPDKLYGLVSAHKIYVRVIGSQTEIGESENICDESYTFILSSNRDVTHNYDIRYSYGTLKVKPLAVISITSASDWKYYDGSPLTNKNYECSITEGEIATNLGHRLTVKVSGSITDIGDTQNTTTVRIVNRWGIDASRYYKIIVSEGLLEVKEKTEVPPQPVEMLVGQINTTDGGYIYLRERSYGNYNGKGWNAATPYWKTLPNGYSYNYLTSIALSNAGQPQNIAEFKDMMIHMLPYYLGFNGNYDFPSVDTVYSGHMTDYIVQYYSLPKNKLGFNYLKGNLGEYAPYEEEYREFVYQNYLTIDDVSLNYMLGVIAEEGFDINDPEVISKVATFVQHAATYDLNYDIAMESEDNVAIAFLDEYKKGICVHYASAATLLYRALGLPARYVEGFALQTTAGEFVDIKTPGHAWVEVYIDEVGWIQVEVTGGASGGSGFGAGEGTHREKLTIKPKYTYKQYDGTPLYPIAELEATGVLAELLELGYTYSLSLTGSQTEIGKGTSIITSFELYDPTFNRVTDDFDILYENGILEVIPKGINLVKVYLYELQKFYDGTPLSFEEYDYEIIEMPDGLDLELSLNISLTDVGEITLSEINENISEYATYRVLKGNSDVTEYYRLVFDPFEFGSENYIPLKIDRRPITLTTASETKVNNGTPLQNPEVTITQGSLASGHTMIANACGTIDYVGSVLNDIESLVILDEQGNNVFYNYDINVLPGTLTIISSDN